MMQGKEREGGTVTRAFTSALAKHFGCTKRLVLTSDELVRLESIEYWANLSAVVKREIAFGVGPRSANFSYRDAWNGRWCMGHAPVEWLVQAKANCLPHVAEQIVCSLCSGGAK